MKTDLSPVALLEHLHRLLTLKGENPFKIRAFEKAAGLLGEVSVDELQSRAKAGTLTELEGVGKGIAEVLTEQLLHGTCRMKDELEAALPEGLLELTTLPGLGPKKALALIEALEIHSISDLEYACRENRLLGLKGFGEKIQAKLLEAIQFQKAASGSQRIDDALQAASSLEVALAAAAAGQRVFETGALRRRLETLTSLEYLVELPEAAGAEQKRFRARVDSALAHWRAAQAVGALPVSVEFAERGVFGTKLARTTASAAHWESLGARASAEAPFVEETQFYESLGLSWIPPECRETGEEVALARTGALEELLQPGDVQGVFHAHTTRSDGVGTLEEMVEAARALGYRYLGITDHSQSAFYAQGLKPESLKEQEKEIRKLQEKYPDLRIFWGIESDILADGSLDYDAGTLKRFDFVIASIHSRFQMDREQMTNRLLTAIRNPATRMLGHLTGRLLLGRPGYALDMDAIIREAAEHDVAIEINAHPARLDIDWRWGSALRRAGCRVAVNPDAHAPSGLADTRYGITVARKALLPKSLVVNTLSAEAVARWLARV